jgi:hypothetical protein
MSTITGFDNQTHGWSKAIVQKMGGVVRASAFLRGEFELKPVPASERAIITVDRSTIRPSYPGWVMKVLYRELEATGPSSFDASTIAQWVHDDQKTDGVDGDLVHDYLKSNSMLEGCLGLRDLEEIQKKGIAFFVRYFCDKVVYGWKSVVQDSSVSGDLCVPYLMELNGEVTLGWCSWHRFGVVFRSDDPALRFV